MKMLSEAYPELIIINWSPSAAIVFPFASLPFTICVICVTFSQISHDRMLRYFPFIKILKTFT